MSLGTKTTKHEEQRSLENIQGSGEKKNHNVLVKTSMLKQTNLEFTII